MTRTHPGREQHASDPSMRVRIWQLAALACVTLVVLVMMLAWSVERERQANVWVVRTQATLRALGAYAGDIMDIETGQRGYLLTHQSIYLEPYYQALASNQGRLTLLKQMITNDGEPAMVRRLSEIFKNKADELALTIRLAKAGDQEAALAVVREGRGRRYTMEFRRLAHEIADSERTLLARRQAAVDYENRNMLISMIIGVLLAAAVIIAGTAKTIALIESRAALLVKAIRSIAAGQLDRRVRSDSPDGIGKIAQAFNDMADRLESAKAARETAEAELVESARTLAAEVVERTAAQGRLFRSVAELKRSNEELDNFAYSASHDLKAPLRGIRNLSEWIAADVKDIAGEDTVANLGLLHNRVERLDMLLDSLLLYSKVGRSGGAPEDIDIAQLIGDIAGYIAPRSGFAVSYRGEVPLVHTTTRRRSNRSSATSSATG